MSEAATIIIDGQQRLTTLTLLITALSEATKEKNAKGVPSKDKLRNEYLKKPHEEGDAAWKLLLSETDRETLCAIIDNRNLPNNPSRRIEQNHKFFEKRLNGAVDDVLVTVWRGLSKLIAIEVALSAESDNPQAIFESMNSKGYKMSESDKIRNFVLMNLKQNRQKIIYKSYWRPMEEDFGQEVYEKHFDRFMRHYLTFRDDSGKIPKEDTIYAAFKERFASDKKAGKDVEECAEELRQFARYYRIMELGTEQDSGLETAFQNLRDFDVSTAYPLLLELYSDYDKKSLNRDDFLETLRLIEAYVFRRSICGIPTHSLNTTFATFKQRLSKEEGCYLESVKAQFVLMSTEQKQFPKDKKFTEDMQSRDLYVKNRKGLNYFLRQYEKRRNKECGDISKYEIEHIMPQTTLLPPEWQKDLGPDWERIWNTYLHRLGNLTLTAYNPELSNKTFSEKREMGGGFKRSGLRLNDGVRDLESWTEETIQKRSGKLAEEATKMWPYPDISREVIERYRSEDPDGGEYTLEDHSNLEGGVARDLYDAFREEVMEFDERVSERILRRYIAYKVKTNFVDVIPRARRLLLYLNMPFSEVNDPRKMCKHFTKGHLGNGDVQVNLKDLNDLEYVIRLVRQSLDWQLSEK